MDSHGLLFSYVDFDVWADGQVECMKDLLVKKKRGKTSSGIHMHGTNKDSGLYLTVQLDVTLKCLGGTAGGTNTGSLSVTSNTISLSTNASIMVPWCDRSHQSDEHCFE